MVVERGQQFSRFDQVAINNGFASLIFFNEYRKRPEALFLHLFRLFTDKPIFLVIQHDRQRCQTRVNMAHKIGKLLFGRHIVTEEVVITQFKTGVTSCLPLLLYSKSCIPVRADTSSLVLKIEYYDERCLFLFLYIPLCDKPEAIKWEEPSVD